MENIIEYIVVAVSLLLLSGLEADIGRQELVVHLLGSTRCYQKRWPDQGFKYAVVT